MNWTPIITLLFSLIAAGLVSWLVYVTIQVTETDRTQEAVLQTNKQQDGEIRQMRDSINQLPLKTQDRFTGKQASEREKTNQSKHEDLQRQIDHLHDDLGNHEHKHSEIKHGE